MMENSKKFVQGIYVTHLIALLSLTSCKGLDIDVTLPSEYRSENSADSPATTVKVERIEELSSTPTAVFVPQEDVSSNDGQIPPTPAPDPLRFVFPDSKPDPVSAWRPPLYPVPWAPTPNDHFYFSRPIAADEVNWPLANYRYGGVFFENVVHTGVDFPASKGTPVIAAGDGKVVWAGWGLYSGVSDDTGDPYGKSVVIRHDFGYQGHRLYTVYGHLDRVDISPGQHVEIGDQLGLVGDTGFVTGPHLHFEVRVGESDFFKTMNPELWLVPPQGWGIVAARIMDTAGQLYSGETLRIQSQDSGRVWKAIPYARGAVNSDPYYQENMVISDLPAGLYDLKISYAGVFHYLTIEIFPGRVTYFSFRGREGFNIDLPHDLGEGFVPPDSVKSSP